MNKPRNKPIVGQTLYLLRNLESRGLIPVKVVSVGRKYFTVQEGEFLHSREQFCLENWEQKPTGYMAQCFIYSSEQERADEIHHGDLVTQLSRYQDWRFLSLEALEQIAMILKRSGPQK